MSDFKTNEYAGLVEAVSSNQSKKPMIGYRGASLPPEATRRPSGSSARRSSGCAKRWGSTTSPS
ncbi:MAG: hypothetical protein R3D59_13575 [Paracoccaceae bacterium]